MTTRTYISLTLAVAGSLGRKLGKRNHELHQGEAHVGQARARAFECFSSLASFSMAMRHAGESGRLHAAAAAMRVCCSCTAFTLRGTQKRKNEFGLQTQA